MGYFLFCYLFQFQAIVTRYFRIDQQIAQYFVHYSEYLTISLLSYSTQIINPLCLQGFQPIMINGLDFSQWGNHYISLMFL